MTSGLPDLKPAVRVQFPDHLSHLHVLPKVVNATARYWRPIYRVRATKTSSWSWLTNRLTTESRRCRGERSNLNFWRTSKVVGWTTWEEALIPRQAKGLSQLRRDSPACPRYGCRQSLQFIRTRVPLLTHRARQRSIAVSRRVWSTQQGAERTRFVLKRNARVLGSPRVRATLRDLSRGLRKSWRR